MEIRKFNADIGDYKQYENDLNLQYWPLAGFRIEVPLEYERAMQTARHAYARMEAERLIDEHGMTCIRNILDRISKRESRTGEDLLKVIEEVTGTDIKARLLRYQTFETKEHGINKYVTAFNVVSKKNFYEPMLFNLLRLHEIRPMPFSATCMRDYKAVAVLTNRLGYRQEADQIMYRCVSLFEKSPAPNAREAAMEMFLLYALDCLQPRRALPVAEQLLERKSDSVLAMVVQMLSDAEVGRLDKAKATARTIQTLVPKENQEKSLAYNYASRILSFDPSKAGTSDPNGAHDEN
jgi:hypothetical protein